MTNGAQASNCNKYGETPLDKAKPHLRELLKGVLTQFYYLPYSHRLKCNFDFFFFSVKFSHCILCSFTTQTKLRKWVRTWLRFPSRTHSGKAPPEQDHVSPGQICKPIYYLTNFHYVVWLKCHVKENKKYFPRQSSFINWVFDFSTAFLTAYWSAEFRINFAFVCALTLVCLIIVFFRQWHFEQTRRH